MSKSDVREMKEHVSYQAVCQKDDCRGIEYGPYIIREYAVSDKSAHEKWHEQRGESSEVVVEKVSEKEREADA